VASFLHSGMADKEIDDGIQNCVILCCEKKIIGFAIANADLLHLLMVDVPYQNSGYGSALLRYIEDKLFAEFDSIHLRTFKENNPAVFFYMKNGWSITDNEEVPTIGKAMLKFEKKRR
jgi:GNAT superfamily N-acetyltransferase